MKENKLKKFLSNFTNIILVLFAMYFIYLISNLIWRNYQIEKKLAAAQNTVDLMEIENFAAKEYLAYYQSDGYKEVELRKRLMLKKAGEQVIILPIRKENKKTTYNLSQTQVEKVITPNFIKWWQIFFTSKKDLSQGLR